MHKINNVHVKGLNNTRDLATLSELCSVKIKKDVLFRSGRIDKISEKKRNKFLSDNNIHTVIDLRNDVEIGESNPITLPDDVKYVKLPILTKEFFGVTHEKKMSKALMKDCTKKAKYVKKDMYLVEMYKDIVFNEESQEYFRKFFKIVTECNDGAILFHCQTGKDRTGIVSMLILLILGVDRDTILEDYMVSQYFNRRYVKSRIILLTISFFIKRDLRLLLKQMLGAKKEYLERTIEAIIEKYHTIDEYLRNALRLTDDDLSQIRNKLLVQ